MKYMIRRLTCLMLVLANLNAVALAEPTLAVRTAVFGAEEARSATLPSADPESADTYDVYVKYTVQGTTYESQLDDYKNSYREGKELTVYYNPEKPGEVLSPGVVGPIVSIALGAVALFVGGGAVLRPVREKAAKKAED